MASSGMIFIIRLNENQSTGAHAHDNNISLSFFIKYGLKNEFFPVEYKMNFFNLIY
jgi:hypothetical protein